MASKQMACESPRVSPSGDEDDSRESPSLKDEDFQLMGEAVIPLLQNKMRRMRNELDIADVKCKATEVQLRADKAKFTDVLNYTKRESENMRVRLQNLEVSGLGIMQCTACII